MGGVMHGPEGQEVVQYIQILGLPGGYGLYQNG